MINTPGTKPCNCCCTCPASGRNARCWFSRDEIGAALTGSADGSGLRLPQTLSISRWLIETWFAGTRFAATDTAPQKSARC